MHAAAHSSERAMHETARVIGATILMGAAALLVMGIQPILLGGLAEKGLLTQGGVGYAATLELFGFAVGASVGPFTMNGHMRLKVFTTASLLALVNISIYAAKGSNAILAERSVAGILEGILMGAASLLLTHTSRPERMNGLLLGLGTAPQIAVAYLLPIAIIPRFGLNSGFVILAIAAAVSAITSYWLVDRVEVHHEHAGRGVQWTPALVGMVTAAFLQNAGCGAAWSYIERLAHQEQLSPAVVGAGIASSLGVQVAGALCAAWLGAKLPSRAVLIAANGLGALVTAALTLNGTPASYVLLTCLFGLFWLAQQPFQVSQLIALDPSRRTAVLLTPIALVGLSVGPMVAAMLITPTDVRPGFWAAAATLAFVMLLLLVPRRTVAANPDQRVREGAPARATRDALSATSDR